MLVPTRNYSNPVYRYGFQGQEKDNEIKGVGNSINYKFRMYDTRVGRFFAVDPLTAKYPWHTPYQFSGNKVIAFVELEGLEEEDPKEENIYGENIYNNLNIRDQLQENKETIKVDLLSDPLEEDMLATENIIEKYNLRPDEILEPIGESHKTTKFMEMVADLADNINKIKEKNITLIRFSEGINGDKNVRYEFGGTDDKSNEIARNLNRKIFAAQKNYEDMKQQYIEQTLKSFPPTNDSSELLTRWYGASISFDVKYGISPQQMLGELYDNMSKQKGVIINREVYFKPDIHQSY